MNHILKSALLKSSIAIACLSASSVYAQEIEEIIVTAKGNQSIDESLFKTHLFTTADINAAQVEDLPALLDRVAGISSVDSGGRGSNTNIFIRGASNDQIIVLVDGIRVGSATLGSAALNSYPIEAIERVEVIKGPFSGIYGSDAVSGVIQIFTKKGNQEGFGSISSTVGSDGLQEYSASFNAGNEKHSFNVALQHENISGFDRTSNGNNPDLDGFRENVISFSGKTTLSQTTVATLSILYSDSDVEIDSFAQSESHDENLNVALNIQTKLSDKLTWTNIIGFNDNESTGNESDISEGAIDSVFSTERESFSSEFHYTANEKTNFTFGADYYREDISDSTTSFTDSSRDNKAYYIQAVSGFNAFSVVASVRHDDNSDYGSDTNRSLALGYEFNDNLRISASYGTAFNAPTFNDLFIPFADFGGFVFLGTTGFSGNPDLLPEESESYEFNIIGEYSFLDWSLSLYQTDFDNLITNIPNLATQILTPANVNSARIEGYEISLSTEISEWNFDLNIDVLSTEDLSNGNRLPGRAEETLNFAVTRDFGKFDLGLNFKFEHDRFDGSTSASRLDSYATYDIRANYIVNDALTLSAKVENLFDKDFTINDGFNTNDRQAEVSIRYAF